MNVYCSFRAASYPNQFDWLNPNWKIETLATQQNKLINSVDLFNPFSLQSILNRVYVHTLYASIESFTDPTICQFTLMNLKTDTFIRFDEN